MLRFTMVDRPSYSKDTNDCTVRALSNAKGIDYSVAHKALKDAGRRPKKGVSLRECSKIYSDEGGELVYINNTQHGLIRTIEQYGDSISSVARPMTFSQFVSKHSKGRYVVLITGHATTVIDGEVVDSYLPGARCRVYMGFQFPEPKMSIVRKYSPVSQSQIQIPLFEG